MFRVWAERMKASFEKCFWIPENKSEDAAHDIDCSLVFRRGIYKDVYHSGFADYQLRPNICIAMTFAPDLFNKQHAKVCL